MGASHPYYPVDLKLPGYFPPLLPFKVVLAIFFSASALLLLVSWVLSGNDSHFMPPPGASRTEKCVRNTGRQRHLHTVDRVVFCWFALTGVIHFVVEGNTNPLGSLMQLLQCHISKSVAAFAGAVVTFADFYKSESSNILFEICEFLHSLHIQSELALHSICSCVVTSITCDQTLTATSCSILNAGYPTVSWKAAVHMHYTFVSPDQDSV